MDWVGGFFLGKFESGRKMSFHGQLIFGNTNRITLHDENY